MINMQKFEAMLTRYPRGAVAAYVVLVGLFAVMTVQTVFEVLQGRAAAASASDILQTLESRNPVRPLAARVVGAKNPALMNCGDCSRIWISDGASWVSPVI